MALIRWQPFQEMGEIQREMNRLFDTVMTPSSTGLSTRDYFPPAELDETAEAYNLKLEVPGMNADDLDIQVTAEAVSITGERKSKTETESNGSTRTEFRYGKFQRVIPLPGRIDHQNVKADYENGILSLSLPKAQDEKSRAVKVSLTA